MQIRGGHAICINSAKGGVGKTFFTINLAGLLSRRGKRVLIIDLDLYSGGIGMALNVNNNASVYDLVEDIKTNRYQSFNHYITKYNDLIDIIVAPNDPRDAIKTDSAYLSNVISYAKHKYDAILIDTTHIFDATNVVALEKADHIIEIVTNDPLDLKNTSNVIKLFKETKINNYHLILNEALYLDKNYFTLFDIKQILKTNIDYIVSSRLHIKNYDKYVIEGKILSLDERVYNKYKCEWDKLEALLDQLYNQKNEGVK